MGYQTVDRVILNAKRMIPEVSEVRLSEVDCRLKIAFATDFHLRKGMNANLIAKILSDMQADVLVLGGDIADCESDAKKMLSAIRPLRFPLGKFAVCGNNDIEAFESYDRLKMAYEKVGIELLLNEGIRLGDTNAFLAGVTDTAGGKADPEAAFRGAENGMYRILASHYPDPGLLKCEPDLMLCGHTHGGQFNFLGITPYAVGYEFRLHLKQISGLRRWGKTQMLVSKGVGASKIPLRIGVKSEMHLLILGSR